MFYTFLTGLVLGIGLSAAFYLWRTEPRRPRFVPPPPRCAHCRVQKGTTMDLCPRAGGFVPHCWESERAERFEMPPVSRPPYAS